MNFSKYLVHVLFYCIGVFHFSTLFSQDTSKEKRPVYLEGSFLYDFPQSYGFNTGIDFPISTVIKRKLNGVIKKQKDCFISFDFGLYHYPFEYTAILPGASFGIRYFKKKYFFSELIFNARIFRTIYDGTVYQVNSNGTITEHSLFGRFYALTGISYSANWQLKNKNNHLSFQLKPTFWVQFPYNSFLKPHLSLEAGFKYALNYKYLNSKVQRKINK